MLFPSEIEIVGTEVEKHQGDHRGDWSHMGGGERALPESKPSEWSVGELFDDSGCECA